MTDKPLEPPAGHSGQASPRARQVAGPLTLAALGTIVAISEIWRNVPPADRMAKVAIFAGGFLAVAGGVFLVYAIPRTRSLLFQGKPGVRWTAVVLAAAAASALSTSTDSVQSMGIGCVIGLVVAGTMTWWLEGRNEG